MKYSYFEENGPGKIEKIDLFEKYFPAFAIYIKNYADSDFDTLIYDLLHVRLHIFCIFSYFSYLSCCGPHILT